MKHVSILIPHGHTSVVNIEGSHQIFNEVNSLLTAMGKPALFNVQLVGISKKPASEMGCSSECRCAVEGCKKNRPHYHSRDPW